MHLKKASPPSTAPFLPLREIAGGGLVTATSTLAHRSHKFTNYELGAVTIQPWMLSRDYIHRK
jgi:hypothetical protein